MNTGLIQQTQITMMQTQSKTSMAADNLSQAGKGKDAAKIARTAEEFEAVFISEMMKPMFEGISTEAPFGGGQGEEVFRSFLLQEYGTMLAAKKSLGIADHVKTEIIKLQEQINE